MARHLTRAILVLIGLFAVVFVLPRIIPVSAAMVDFGFHKRNPVQNADLWAALPVDYLQSSTCSDCHQTEYGLWQKSNHKTVACENCHGSARDHVENNTPITVDRSRELCGTCHERVVGRPSTFPQVDMNEMGGGAECVTCHSPHDPRAGMPPQVPHALGDRSNCQSCHAPHEPLDVLPPPIPHTLDGRTDCLACHGSPELRGATIPKVTHSLEGRSDCMVCHNLGGIKPFPSDHVGRTSATCLNCHRSS
jgi:hypothetical protein